MCTFEYEIISCGCKEEIAERQLFCNLIKIVNKILHIVSKNLYITLFAVI
jgi:hypothetical protein